MTKKPWGKNGVFGSTERRFVPFSSANVVVPGPGQYIHPGSLGDGNPQVTELKKTNAVFTSKTKRMNQSAQNLNNIVQYDNSQNTIALNVRKKVETQHNPLLANLTGKNSTTLAFQSNAPRFGG